MKLSTTMIMNEKLLPESKKAFTLAEVLITLSILGVVAALTIPSLVNRQSDLAAQVKLKKAISSYEDFAGTFMAEKEKPNLKTLTCDDLKDHFKIVQEGATKCDFTTADGVAWHFNTSTAGTGESAVTSLTGEATAADVDKSGARYAVYMWTENNRANTNGAADNVSNIPSSADTTLYTGASGGTSSALISGRYLVPAPEFIQNNGKDCTKNAEASVDASDKTKNAIVCK